MSIIRAAFFSKTQSVAEITALVGARVYPDAAESSAVVPYIVFDVSDDTPVSVLNPGGTAIKSCSLNVEVYADKSTVRDAVKASLYNALHGAHNKSWDTVNIRSCNLEDSHSDKEEPVNNSQKYLFVEYMTFSVWYVDAVPNNL